MMPRDLRLKVTLDPGTSHYLFDPDMDHIEAAIREVFPRATIKRLGMYHSIEAGTLIQLVITGLAAGSAIVMAEFLKEAGKDLWKAFRKVLIRREGVKPRFERAGRGDDLILVLRMRRKLVFGRARFRLTSDGSTVLRSTLDRGLCELHSLAERIMSGGGLPGNPAYALPGGAKGLAFMRTKGGWVLEGPLCPNCAHAQVDVNASPCRACRFRGAKLGFQTSDVLYDLNGEVLQRLSYPRFGKRGWSEPPPENNYRPVAGPNPLRTVGVWSRVSEWMEGPWRFPMTGPWLFEQDKRILEFLRQTDSPKKRRRKKR